MNSLRYLNVTPQRGWTCRAIVAALETAIPSGHIRAADVMPSQRLMADFMGVHTNTVNRAMREAARRGLVSAHTRPGTTVIARPKT